MEWFKMRTAWGEAIELLSDEEAGRAIKRIFDFVLRAEKTQGNGREDIFTALAFQSLQRDIDEYLTTLTEEERKELKQKAYKERARRYGRKGAEAKLARADEPAAAPDTPSPDPDVPSPDPAQPSPTPDAPSPDPGVPCPDPGRPCPDPGRPCPDPASQNGSLHYKEPRSKNPEAKTKSTETEPEERNSETQNQKEGSTGSEPFVEASELPVAEIPLNNGTQYPVYRKDVEEYTALYPGVDIEQELRKMRGWCLANPSRRKTKRGVRAFIHTWMCKEQDRAKGPQGCTPENPFLAYALGEKEIGGSIL